MRRSCLLALCAVVSCKVKDQPPITERWTDSFDRDVPGESYHATGAGYAIKDGALSARGAKNHPLWLRKKLPRNVQIDVDVWSTEPRGDIKLEVFGDGYSSDPDGGAYMATSYVLIFGGWSNSKSMIARMDEHAKDVVQRTEPKVIPNQRYHWKIVRKSSELSWYVDDMTTPFLKLLDPRPLEGAGHQYLGFNNWETDTWFDNLVITPL